MLNLVVQSITNEGGSLNHSQSPDHTVIDIASVANDALLHRESRKVRRIKWALLLGSFILEGSSLAFDQLSAPKKPIYGLMSMISASLGLLISIIELYYRVRENDMIIWRLLGDALENFGFFGSTWQCIYAVVQYVYIYKKKTNNPIKISVLPLIFLISATISRLYKYICNDAASSHPRGESSMDASRTTILSRDEDSVSLNNARAIETVPVLQDEPGVLITPKKSGDDTGIHKRVRQKKRAWSAEEDNKLRSYIQKYGYWNWRKLPEFAGLQRSGKSCRRRWMNYLRPVFKRGNYTEEEDDLIIQLREKIGNKWSAIADRLPGRTDNDIKNYWHTHLKKRAKGLEAGAQSLSEGALHGDVIQNSSSESEGQRI